MMTLIMVLAIIQCICSIVTIYLIVNYLGVKITFEVKKRGFETQSTDTPPARTPEEQAEYDQAKHRIQAQNKAFEEIMSYSPEIAYGLKTKQE